MDHIQIVKNAFRTTLRHRALWILGLLWALVGGGGGGSFNFNPGSGGSGYRMDENDLPFNFNPEQWMPWIILACCVLIILAIAATVVRYVLQAGIYRTLHELDHTGAKPTVRGGFRQGWNRRTWRLFLQDLAIALPVVLIAIIAFLLAASPLLLLAADNDAANAIGVVTAIGLILLCILALIIVATIIGVLSQFWYRAAAIGDEGAFDAIRTAWRLARGNLRDVAIMWLLMFGLGILFALVMIPVLLLLLVLIAIVAGGPGMLIYQATESLGAALAWGAPVGFILFVVPMLFISGLYLIFQASVWNQVYDQCRDLSLNEGDQTASVVAVA